MPSAVPATILTVDDSEANRYVVARILRHAGYSVLEASTGEEAIELLQSDPDLILLDVNLPDANGRDICRKIKSNPETASIMVLQISASLIQTEARVMGLDAGADGYLTYPMEPAELLANVRALLRIRRAEEEARQVARQWEATFDAISDGICLVDLNGVVQRCSTRVPELFGCPQPEILGKNLQELARQRLDVSVFPIQQIARERTRQSQELLTGNRWIHVTGDPVLDARRCLTGAVYIFSDVTQRKNAEAALQARNLRLRLLSETSSELLLNDDPVEHVAAILERVSRHLGLEVYFCYLLSADGQELRLQTYGGISRETAEGIHRLDLRRAAPAVKGEAEILAADDIQRSSDPVSNLIRSLGLSAYACHPLLARDQLIGTVSFGSRHVDDIHRDELSLIQTLCDQLAMALERGRLFAQLEQRAQQLAEADRRKDEFLAVLGHELRNPLGAISNSLHILEMIGSREEAEVQQRATISRQQRHLARMVDDLLDVSRFSRGRIELRTQRVNAVSLVEHAVRVIGPLVEERQHLLTLEVSQKEAWIEADPTRIEQVVNNLLTNAVKYTPPGGEIFLGLDVKQDPEGGSVTIRVRDSGIGIDAGILPHIFGLFTQAEQSLDRSSGGLGIGLTLVQRLVELHGGTVEAFSKGEGRGSEFVVRLPLAEARVPSSEATPAHPGTRASNGVPGPLTILVVEDIMDARETLRDLLELWGHEVFSAADGAEGIQVIRESAPNVALVDIGLPGMDGYEVARQVRSQPDGQRIRLVAITGYGQPKDRQKALDAGFDAHLVKPIDPQLLAALLADSHVRDPHQNQPLAAGREGS